MIISTSNGTVSKQTTLHINCLQSYSFKLTRVYRCAPISMPPPYVGMGVINAWLGGGAVKRPN